MKYYNMDFKELDHGKIQIIKKQIFNAINGTTFSNNDLNQTDQISSKQLSVLLDTIFDLRTEVKELKKKLKEQKK